MKISDQEEWISNRVEELAVYWLGESYGEMSEETCRVLGEQAEKEWVDHYSGYCDFVYEMEKNRRICAQRSTD